MSIQTQTKEFVRNNGKSIPLVTTLICIGLLGYMYNQNQIIKEELNNPAEINYQAQVEYISTEIEKTNKELEAKQLEKEAYEKLNQAQAIKQEIQPVESPKANDLVVVTNDKVDEPKVIYKDDITELPPTVEIAKSSVSERFFKMNNGTYKKGSEIIEYTKANPNGLKLWNAFKDRYGVEVADKATISLHYENGSLKPDTVGVCSPKHQIGGDYRNCNYADLNSAGMDAGLKQINTYYQRYRIAKLGGPNCEPSNSRDIADACTNSQVKWLQNVDNNIKIALDIYSESGFSPWYGAKKAGIV